jgi:hemoglobin-like flavoprotein
MKTREKQLVRESFQCIREEAGPLALLFYGRLFELEPKLRPMFHGDIAQQGLKLMAMLAVIIDSIDRFEALTPALHAMGQRHTSYGVMPRDYEIVERALIWAVGQALATGSGSETLAAWRTLIQEVSTVMKAGADQLNRSPEAQGDRQRIGDTQ